MQDSFVAMHDGWQRLRDAESALAYLRQAVLNRSRSVLRHRAVVAKHPEKLSPDMPSAEHGALVQLERSAVIAALRKLPGGSARRSCCGTTPISLRLRSRPRWASAAAR